MMMLAIAALLLEPASAPLPQTRQQIFDAAQAAFEKGDNITAAAGFERVLNPEGKDSRSDGLIRRRYAVTLSALGRTDEAMAHTERAARELAATSHGPDPDLSEAWRQLADLRRFDLRMEEALAAYDQARATLPPGEQTLRIDVGIILAAMVTHPDRAAAVADTALADKDSVKKLDANDRAFLYTLRARAELNRGAAARAASFSRSAVSASGDLTTTKVSLLQVGIRADAALIFTKMGDVSNARQYLAYSGAGGMPNMSWLTQADLDLPVCNEEMQPQDVAVVQFGIAQDGTVNAIQPIYSSRPGASGVAFARAIRDWQFARSAVADLNGFWRGSVRLELRCVARPAPQSIAQPFLGAASRWFLGQMVKFTPDGDLSAETTSAMQRANLAPLADLLGKAQKSAGKRDSTPYAAQIDAVLVTAHAPPAVRATFRDPIRLVATLHRSLIEKKMGDAAAAQDRLAKAGLDAQQCSLFDVRPVATNASISSSAFPDEALRWGMEGVARESFDIAADGKVTGIRTVLAYPPFVFADATERAVGRFRYIAPTLDGAALGCAGQSINVHFKVPK